MNGELVVPTGTAVKRLVIDGLSGSVGSDNHRNRLKSLSSACRLRRWNAFSISVAIPYLWVRNRKSIANIL